MSPVLKEHLLSGAQTFLATFLVVLGTSITATDTLEWSGAIIGALLLSAVRAALKEVLAKFAPLALGGRQGPTLFGKRS